MAALIGLASRGSTTAPQTASAAVHATTLRTRHKHPRSINESDMANKPLRLNLSANRDRLFYFNYEKIAQPINVTTLFPTTTFADPRGNHPLYVKTTRRLRQFDPTKLHWTVAAPVDLSKSAFVRKTAARRVREAFQQELRREGWDPDGRRRAEGGADGNVRNFDLSGALRMGLVKDAFAVTATSEEVKESASSAVSTLLRLHGQGEPKQRRSSKQDLGRKGPSDLPSRMQGQDEPQQRRPSKQDHGRKGPSDRIGDRTGGEKTPGLIRRVSHR
jgi:hypothetical protein